VNTVPGDYTVKLFKNLLAMVDKFKIFHPLF
jgi:hypothetical protein